MARRPLIAIPGHVETVDSVPYCGVRSSYCESITGHGGMPVIVPPQAGSQDVEGLLDSVDGVLLPGGVDIHPGQYGEVPNQRLGAVDIPLDQFELPLIRQAHARDMPMLALCRGHQAMAVALGGTLYQDLPTQLPGLDHEVRDHGRAYLAHGIRISSRSHLAGVLGVDEVRVNSLHHQGVDYVPDTLTAVGWSEDGLVEALEAPDRTYFLSVQCHPEELWSIAEPRFSRLFASFVEAARSRRATLLL